MKIETDEFDSEKFRLPARNVGRLYKVSGKAVSIAPLRMRLRDIDSSSKCTGKMGFRSEV